MELDREAAAALGIPGDAVARAAARRREGRTLGEELADLGATDAATFARALAEAAGLPFAPAPPALPARELTAVLPMPFAKRHLVLPLARDGAGLAVALADPAALAPLDDLRLLYRAPLWPLVVPAPALRDAITRAYDATARSASCTPCWPRRRAWPRPSPRASRSWPDSTSRSGGCRRTGASACASPGATSTCACRSCRPPSGSAWRSACSTV